MSQRNGTVNGDWRPTEHRRRMNQFGDYEDVSNMSVPDWEYRWSLDQTKFHMPKTHPMLVKHIDKLRQGQIRQRVFVPLCGKSLDMKWLSDNGHEVVGNEAVDAGCRQFFEEENIPYTCEPLDGVDGALYSSTDGSSIKIYRCDCFDLNSKLVGTFDCIWDRGGFVALPITERMRYANMIQGLMRKDCRYLLDCFLVDNTRFAGPPFDCKEEDVSKCFGDCCVVDKIDIVDAFTKWQAAWGITSFVEEVYLLRPR